MVSLEGGDATERRLKEFAASHGVLLFHNAAGLDLWFASHIYLVAPASADYTVVQVREPGSKGVLSAA